MSFFSLLFPATRRRAVRRNGVNILPLFDIDFSVLLDPKGLPFVALFLHHPQGTDKAQGVRCKEQGAQAKNAKSIAQSA